MTKIEWTDVTWNPVVGCSVASPGCDHCYAAGVASRQMQPAHQGLTIGRQWNGTVRLLPERLGDPLRWRKPRRVFVCSMSDLFHPDVPEEFITSVFDTMACHGPIAQHTFQVLTKRPQRMRNILNRWAEHEGYVGAPNVWLGTSIESHAYLWRAKHLRATPAAVRFLSIEPLIAPIPYLDLDLRGIHWVIVGGESGPSARPMHPDWVRAIRDRCIESDVPFFFKQWGAWREYRHGDDPARGVLWEGCEGDSLVSMVHVGKARAGRELDGRTFDEYPTITTGATSCS